MSDRRRGGSGPGTPLRRAVGACGAVTTFVALGLCSLAGAPAGHADLEDLFDPIITAATTGLDEAGAAFSTFSPDDLVAGAADFGSFADQFGQIDQLVQNLSSQLDDQLRGLGADWPDNLTTSLGEPGGQSLADLPGSAAAEEPGTGGFLFGDDGGHAAAGDATSGATTLDPAGHTGAEGGATDGSTGDGHDSTAGSTDNHSANTDSHSDNNGNSSANNGNSSANNGNNSDNNSNNSKFSTPSMPKISSPGGGSGGGGNGGGNAGRAKPNNNPPASGAGAPAGGPPAPAGGETPAPAAGQ